jgi:hypothetical protein
MCDEYRSAFISSLILDDNYQVDEYDDFTATIYSSKLPLFKDMQSPWKLKFTIDDKDKLAWSAIEYDNEDDMHGTEIMSGNVVVTTKDTPNTTYLIFDDISDDSPRFIETMFPGKPEVRSCSDNLFSVDGKLYNFDTMVADDGYIHFDFKLSD